jgi:hypothetical protein
MLLIKTKSKEKLKGSGDERGTALSLVFGLFSARDLLSNNAKRVPAYALCSACLQKPFTVFTGPDTAFANVNELSSHCSPKSM